MPESSYPFDLILFDLDGTLVETAAEIADAVNDTLAELALAPLEQPRVERWIGLGTRELLAQALAFRSGVPVAQARASGAFAAVESRFAAHYLQRCGTRSRLYPRVRETLQALRGIGVKLAVLTNKEGCYTQRVLDAHALVPLFDHVVCGDTFAVKKPDPRGAQDCMQRFGVEPGRTLLVGDSSIDVDTARRAAMAVWALPYGYNMGEPIEACAPDRVIQDVSWLLPDPQTGSVR